MAAKFNSIELSTGWTFKQADDSSADAWLPVQKVPTNVHLDLLDNKKQVATNCRRLQRR
jgi:beta-mannosidase